MLMMLNPKSGMVRNGVSRPTASCRTTSLYKAFATIYRTCREDRPAHEIVKKMMEKDTRCRRHAHARSRKGEMEVGESESGHWTWARRFRGLGTLANRYVGKKRPKGCTSTKFSVIVCCFILCQSIRHGMRFKEFKFCCFIAFIDHSFKSLQ